MAPFEIFLILFFTYLLLSHFYNMKEGLANSELSTKEATQVYLNQNKIKNTQELLKKKKKEINNSLDSFEKGLKKSQAQSKKNSEYTADTL